MAGLADRVTIDPDKLKAWRGFRLMTQAALAKEVGISTSAIKNIENRYHGATPATIEKLAYVLQVTVDDLLVGGDDG